MYHKSQSHDVWFLRYRVWETECFVILDYFLHFQPPNNPENQNFEKIKNMTGDIIILQKDTINDNDMMYGSWDMTQDIEFFVFLGHFLPFYSTNNPKNQNFEKMKKTLEISSFYTSVSKSWLYATILMDVTIFHFGLFFDLFFNLLPFKMPRDIIILHICTENCDQMYSFCDMTGWTDWWTDKQTEKVTYKSGWPN